MDTVGGLAGQPQFPQPLPVRAEQLQELVHHLGEHPVVSVERRPHPPVLGALPGKEQRHRGCEDMLVHCATPTTWPTVASLVSMSSRARARSARVIEVPLGTFDPSALR